MNSSLHYNEFPINVQIIAWKEECGQVEMKDDSGNRYYLENCIPPDGLNACCDSAELYNALGQLLKNGNNMGPYVLHSNDKQHGVLCRMGDI